MFFGVAGVGLQQGQHEKTQEPTDAKPQEPHNPKPQEL